MRDQFHWRRLIAVVSFGVLLLKLSGCTQEAPAQELLTPGHSVTLAWDKAFGADGSCIRAGIASGDYLFTYDAGTNEEITISGLQGGFTWYFAAVDYYASYQLRGTNEIRRLEDSGPSNEISWTAPCPAGEPQGPIITNGVWVIAATGAAWLQTSTNLLHWTYYAGLTNGVNIITGPVTNSQFFRLQL
jgi:hypothetical protein